MISRNKSVRSFMGLVSVLAVAFLAARAVAPVFAMSDSNQVGHSSKDSGFDDSSSSEDSVSKFEDSSQSDAWAGELEFKGTLTVINGSMYTIGGLKFPVGAGTELKQVAVGDQVEVHYIKLADGSFKVREIEKATGTGLDDSSDDVNDDRYDDHGDDQYDDHSDDQYDDHSDDSVDQPEIHTETELGS